MSDIIQHRVAFIVNAKISRKELLLVRIKNIFAGIPHTVFQTAYPHHAKEITMAAILQNYNCIVACGGDGTLHECVNGIMHANANIEVRLALLPMGTGNDFARTMQLTPNVEALHAAIVSNRFILTDTGKIMHGKSTVPEYFINIADAGFGAAVVHHMLSSKNIAGKKIQYQLSILRTLFSFKKKMVEIVTDDIQYKGKVMMVAICNGKYFGSGLGIAPDATVDDGLLDIVIVGNISMMDYLLNVVKLKRAKKLLHPSVIYCRTKTITIKNTTQEEIMCEADGELLGAGSLSIEVLPARIKFIC